MRRSGVAGAEATKRTEDGRGGERLMARGVSTVAETQAEAEAQIEEEKHQVRIRNCREIDFSGFARDFLRAQLALDQSSHFLAVEPTERLRVERCLMRPNRRRNIPAGILAKIGKALRGRWKE
jgi:hypothetical protein